MKVPANNRENPQSELPERYARLVEYVSRKHGGLKAAFDTACRRIESRRLLAEAKLRKALQKYWSLSRKDQNALRCFDLLDCFQEYAEVSFKAAGEECLTLFQDAELYGSFLHTVQDWALEGIFPKPETVKQSRARLLQLVEGLRPLTEQLLANGLWDAPSALELDTLADDLRTSSDEPIDERLADIILQSRIIGLRENFAVFEARCEKRSEDLFTWGGDWERLLDDSLVDTFKTGTDSLGASAVGSAFKSAFRKAENRLEAKEFWEVALEQMHATLLAAWWKTSADARARGGSIDQLDTKAENERDVRASDGLSTSRAPKAARRSPRYEAIDETLRQIAPMRPRRHDDVFENLDRRAKIPNAEPFQSAGGWVKGFRADPQAARAWLSKSWSRLKLPPFPRGPK